MKYITINFVLLLLYFISKLFLSETGFDYWPWWCIFHFFWYWIWITFHLTFFSFIFAWLVCCLWIFRFCNCVLGKRNENFIAWKSTHFSTFTSGKVFLHNKIDIFEGRRLFPLYLTVLKVKTKYYWRFSSDCFTLIMKLFN